MSKFSLNDKVSFINEKQDGIIRDINTDGSYIVEIEDGFTIKALERELVLIKSSFQKPLIKVDQKTDSIPEEKTIDLIKGLSLAKDGVYFIAAPSISGMVSTGPADLYIVNTTDYDALVACSYLHQKSLSGIFSGKLFPGQQEKISRLKREEVMDKGELFIQVMLHQSGSYIQQPVTQRELNILFPDHRNGKSTLPAPYAFCNIQSILSTTPPDEIQLDALQQKFSAKDLRDSITSKNNPKNFQEKSSRTPSQFEVDLHIEELISSIAGLSNADMIEIQLRHFRKKLDEAILNKHWKIVFIHGVGNGRLKSEIRKELTTMNIRFSDGSYERYGGGATEVTI